jgi:hypothetical protein
VSASLDPPLVFPATAGASSKPWLFLAGGIVLVLVALGGFFLALFTRAGMIQMQLMCVLPMLGAVGCFSVAYVTARAPREVALGEDGITLVYRTSSRRLPWDQVAWANTLQQAMTSRKVLKIFGNDGKSLATITGDIIGFDAMCQTIANRLSLLRSPHQSSVRWRKARRQGAGLMIGGICACALAGAVGWIAWDDQHSAALLQSSGTRGEGVVLSKSIAPDGRTHRIEYRVVSGAKSDTHNIEIIIPLWQTLSPGDHLAIKTVPNRPEISELLEGEVRDDSRLSPAVSAGLVALVFLAGIVFFVVGVLSRKGILVETDPVTKKFKIERLVRS